MENLKNINLVRKIAHSFNNTTGISFDELFSEALVSYYEALADYKEEKGKLSVWCWLRMQNNLINFIKKEHNETIVEINNDSFKQTVKPDIFFELLDEFNTKSQYIINKLLEDPHKYLEYPPKYSRGIIRDELREEGWKWNDIWNEFRNIKEILLYE
jgi:DNA-directed RNA polymerase specialized sigma subunit